MRRPLAIAVLALAGSFAALGNAPAADAASARTPAKVVIVVGATHGTTPTYRKYADAAYAEALKYTPNVVKVYSPNATWSRVKTAAVGASILIYFGHGNGWPSPYTYDPQYTTKDGMGLNADLNGDGKLSDYENKYYGEPYMKSLDLAPNAIVLLHNLCYASGNSEPGNPQPTVGVARQPPGVIVQRDRRRLDWRDLDAFAQVVDVAPADLIGEPQLVVPRGIELVECLACAVVGDVVAGREVVFGRHPG